MVEINMKKEDKEKFLKFLDDNWQDPRECSISPPL